MRFHEQDLEGVYVIEAEPHEDERGLLRRHFCQKEFMEHGLIGEIRQCNVSENKRKHTLRGFHYQLPPRGESKTLSCMKGSIHDIVVDLRVASSTSMRWQSFELSAESRLQLHVPAGCATAYLTLEDDTSVFYYHSEFYEPGVEAGIRYNDPLFGFVWPAEPSRASARDLNMPDFDRKIGLYSE